MFLIDHCCFSMNTVFVLRVGLTVFPNVTKCMLLYFQVRVGHIYTQREPRRLIENPIQNIHVCFMKEVPFKGIIIFGGSLSSNG